MNALLIVMLALLAVSLATIAYIALRNRIMFLMGVRNIPRRLAQTVLIIVGLMLSTLIISAAFTTGDTVDHSVTSLVYRVYGHIDEIVEYESQGDAPSPNIHIPRAAFNTLEAELKKDPNIDGLAPAAAEDVPIIDQEQRLSAPSARFLGLDETHLEAFPDLEDPHGNPLDLTSLGPNEVFINESLADELNAKSGSDLVVTYNGQEIPLRVAGIARDRGVSGSFGTGQKEGLVTRLSVFQQLLGRPPDQIDFIMVSNTGDLRDGVKRTDVVEQRLEDIFKARDLPLSISSTKKESLDEAELAGNFMMTFFLVFGMFSIAAGILLIVMIFVMLAAERKSELGMARALGTKRWHLVETFVAEGMGYNLVSALVGAALGVVIAFGLTQILSSIFANSDFSFSIEPHVTPRSLVISYSLGVVLTFLTVAFSSWRASRLNIVRAIRDLPEPESKPSGRSLIIALVLAPLAGLIIAGGFLIESAFFFGVGFLFASLSAALLARQARLPEQAAFTAIGLFVLFFWAMSAGERIPGLKNLNGGPEMFILSGIMMVAASTYVLVYNADLLLAAITFAGGRLKRLLPAVRMAVAYPLASKFRTGMTLAMISLVVFALTMMSMMNTNFDQVFLNDENFGGWDVEVRESPANPLGGDLNAALLSNDPQFDVSDFQAVGSLGLAQPFGAELCQPDTSDCSDDEEFKVYVVKGADETFLRESSIPLQARATGYDTDRNVWDAVQSDTGLAVIDVNALGSQFLNFGSDADFFQMKGLKPDVTSFDPVTLEVRDSAGGASGTVRVIGILKTGASGGANPLSGFFGMITNSKLVSDVFGEPERTNYFVRLIDKGDAVTVARNIEGTLLTLGVEASSMKKDREEDSALFNSFFYLMQAFAGLGLFVGIAAVGVVAFRSVVERRQEIGMLRAIGFSKGMVALSFVIESSFIAMLGVLSGIGLAVLLASFLLTSDELGTAGITRIIIPWGQIALIGVFALGATLLMSFVPSRQAASVPVAEALRYE
jgi:putative ABC transport system permease protein